MSTISASTTSTTAFGVTADTTGALVLQTGSSPTTAVTIDTSQKVGIGTSTPNKILATNNTVQIGTSSASDATTMNGTSWGLNRDVDNGTIFNSAGGAFQFQHTKSTTLASDLLDLQVYSYTGTQQTGKAMTVNGLGYISIPGHVIQTAWYDMGSGNAQGTNSTAQSTAFSISFTPRFSTSKILHICTLGLYFICDGRFYIGRNGSIVSNSLGDTSRVAYDWYNDMEPTTVTYLDSPATTSAITYNWWAGASGCGNVWAIGSSSDFNSSWTVMEIGQ